MHSNHPLASVKCRNFLTSGQLLGPEEEEEEEECCKELVCLLVNWKAVTE
jgi:hypothetical protein